MVTKKNQFCSSEGQAHGFLHASLSDNLRNFCNTSAASVHNLIDLYVGKITHAKQPTILPNKEDKKVP